VGIEVPAFEDAGFVAERLVLNISVSKEGDIPRIYNDIVLMLMLIMIAQ
jgi:hypothetical protein